MPTLNSSLALNVDVNNGGLGIGGGLGLSGTGGPPLSVFSVLYVLAFVFVVAAAAAYPLAREDPGRQPEVVGGEEKTEVAGVEGEPRGSSEVVKEEGEEGDEELVEEDRRR